MVVAHAVLVDMDATLVDSAGVVEALWTEFAGRHGLPVEMVLGAAHGRSVRGTIGRFLPPGPDLDALASAFEAAQLARPDGIAMPGARRLLEALRGARVAVVTSRPRALAGRQLVRAGLPVPDVLIAGDDVPAGRPDPAGHLEAARRLGVAPARCLALEGTEPGVRAALAAGAAVVVVGHRHVPAALGLCRVPDLGAIDVAVLDDATVRTRRRPEPGPRGSR